MSNDFILASEAALLLRLEHRTLTQRCKRGTIPGAFKREVDGEEKWHIPRSYLAEQNSKIDSESYEAIYAEWIRRMKIGLGYKNPCSPRTIERMEYGMEKFWIFVYKPPTEIKTSFKKGEPRPKPKMSPQMSWLTAENLAIAIANIPVNHKEEKCHYALREITYKSVRSFYNLLLELNKGSEKEFLAMGKIKFKRIYDEKKKSLSLEQLIQLIKANETLMAGRTKAKQEFDRSLTRLCLYLPAFTGLRRDEISKLKLEDVNLETNELTVIGKGNKLRTIGFNETVAYAIRQWLTHRPKKSPEPYLLLTLEGEQLKPDLIYKRVRRIGNLAKITIWPHALRHTYASLLLDSGVEMQYITELLGHSRISFTETTYIHINKKAAIAAGKGFNPEGVPMRHKARENIYIKALDGLK